MLENLHSANKHLKILYLVFTPPGFLRRFVYVSSFRLLE